MNKAGVRTDAPTSPTRPCLYSLEQVWPDAVALEHPPSCECGVGDVPDELTGAKLGPRAF